MTTTRVLYAAAFAAAIVATGALAGLASTGEAESGELYAGHAANDGHHVAGTTVRPVSDIGVSADAMGAMPLGGSIQGGTKYDVTQPHDAHDMPSMSVANRTR